MHRNEPLNIFYDEPDPDRWFALDRYPRRLIRRVVRGTTRPGGHKRVFLNLCSGLDRLGIPYRINDYNYALRHPGELICILGKPFLLDQRQWKNPILFGSAGYSHPLDDPDLLNRLPVKKVLVPGPWMKSMRQMSWGDAVESWPVGIDTELWRPSTATEKAFDVLIYDKVLWNQDDSRQRLLPPIRETIKAAGLSATEIRYGYYHEEDYQELLVHCRAMIYLCEHETQGIAYQQALASGVPIFAWDQGGPWRDPSYFPDRVIFQPVTSVPYWDEGCGSRFRNIEEFTSGFDQFWRSTCEGQFAPRQYIIEHLSLEKCAFDYAKAARALT